jgi:hypothetical protein
VGAAAVKAFAAVLFFKGIFGQGDVRLPGVLPFF